MQECIGGRSGATPKNHNSLQASTLNAGRAAGVRSLLPSSEQLAVYQINTFTGAVYLYHPLTPVDMSAFEQFTLTEGDYSFLDGALNLVGHEGLLPFLR